MTRSRSRCAALSLISLVAGCGGGASVDMGGGDLVASLMDFAGLGGDGPTTMGADDMAAPGDLAAGGSPDLKFRPNPNGFPFENYGNGNFTNLTADDLRRLFGDGVCGSMMGGCVLTPAAQAWMDQQNKGMDGGHCEGFAALSLLFYLQKKMAKDFGDPSTFNLKLDGNAALQREIAYWFVTQATSPTKDMAVNNKTPNEILDALTAALATGSAGETYTLGIYKPGFKEGHAITPYAVVDNGGGKLDVMVYDNNYPNMERKVSFDRNANTWNYMGSTNPQVPGSDYVGDAMTKTLDLTPTSARLAQQTCPFCADMAMGGPQNGNRGALMTGGGDLLATDDGGHHLGYMAGALVNEIPGAKATPWKSGDLWQYQHDPSFSIPEGTGLSFTIDGSALKAASPTDLEVYGEGYTFGAEGIALDPNQKDTVTISKTDDQITYQTAGMETPTLRLGVQTAGPDWTFLIKAIGDMNGQKVDLKLDLAKQQLRVEVSNMSGMTSYDIEIHRIDAMGDQVFTHHGNAEKSADAWFLDYGTWAGNGKPMAAEVDTGTNGSIDTTNMLSDDA